MRLPNSHLWPMAILILKDIDGHRMLWQIYLWSKYWSVRVKSVGNTAWLYREALFQFQHLCLKYSLLCQFYTFKVQTWPDYTLLLWNKRKIDFCRWLVTWPSCPADHGGFFPCNFYINVHHCTSIWTIRHYMIIRINFYQNVKEFIFLLTLWTK